MITGRLIRRYKRFLADVRLSSGEVITAHCPNTGAMLGCREPGSRIWLSESDNPKRRYRHTWELVETAPGVLVGIHTGRTNRLAAEALSQGLLADVVKVRGLKREVSVADLGCRIDFLVETQDGPDCYMEIKNVTAAVEKDVALFPDAVSERAVRHLDSLVTLVDRGHRAALCFCVQRSDVRAVRPASEIHPEYATALARAAAAGVQIAGFRCRVSTDRIEPVERVRVEVDVV
ncbi:MAG: DNA/RNA nuclease SfsA [Gammaproteobacteria bacterium]|jgi:sugar fermentation stimulation protein A